MWRHQGHLIDVLQRAPTLQDRASGASQHQDGGLRHLGVLQGRDRVGDPWHHRHSHDTRCSRESGYRVGRKDSRGFVANIHDPNAELFRAYQNGRYVPTAQGEEEAHTVLLEDLRNEVTTVHRFFLPGALRTTLTSDRPTLLLLPHMRIGERGG